jgi:uncharacterized protein
MGELVRGDRAACLGMIRSALWRAVVAVNGKAAGVRRKQWYAEGLRFECCACGRCCGGEPGYIWATPEEIRQAAEVVGLDVLDFCTMYVAEYDRGFSLREMENGDCCMLRGGRCTIYTARPLQCRTWPFWPTNLASPADWEEAGRRCPGIGQGRLWKLAEIVGKRDSMNV